MRSLRLIGAGCILVAGMTLVASRDAVAQSLGVPGSPQPRMGGMGGSGVPRPMAGSSVPMMGRQGAMRPGQSFGATSPNSRYSGRFRASSMAGQMSGAGGFSGVRTSDAVRNQAKNAGRGVFGF